MQSTMNKNIDINSKGRFYYYKIDKLLKCIEHELVLKVHDFQTRTFISVKILCKNTKLYLMKGDGTEYRLIGISKVYPSTSFYLCGHPTVNISNGSIDFMANRMSGVKNLSDLYGDHEDANGNLQKNIYLDSWLITDAFAETNNMDTHGKAESES